MPTKSRAEIDAEKAHKSRPDLLPAVGLLACGDVQAFGLAKHGPCTWRVAGTAQAKPETHGASGSRHAAHAFEDPWSTDPDTGLLHLAHLGAQVLIELDCLRRSDPERFDAIRATLPTTLERMARKHDASIGSAFAAGAVEGENPRMLACPLFAGGVCLPYYREGEHDGTHEACFAECARLRAERGRPL